MPSLYLHIGFHKTGSTSLQYSLRKHEAQLKKEGIAFLSGNKSGNSSDFISVNLNQSKAKVNISDAFLRLLKNSNGLDAVISAEHLSFIEDRVVLEDLYKKIKETYEEVKVVAYIRQQHKLAISFKQQAAKQPHRNAAPSSQLCGHSVNNPLPRLTVTLANYLDYHKKQDLWSSVFGEDNVIFRLYDKDSLDGGCICKDFSNTINIKCPLPSMQVNEGFGVVKTEIKHFLIQTKAPLEIVEFFNSMSIDDADYPLIRKNLDVNQYLSYFHEANKNIRIDLDEIEKLNKYEISTYYSSAVRVDYLIKESLKDSFLEKKIVSEYFEFLKGIEY